MSQGLHIWEGPAPESADEVPGLIDGPRGHGLAPSAGFPQFASALKKKYPDAHTLEAAGKDPDSAVWSDSPLTGETDDAFMGLGLRAEMTDRKLMHFIVKTAGAHGLHVYDMATGELWRKGDVPPAVKPPEPPRLPAPGQPLMSLHRFARLPVGNDRLGRVPPKPTRQPDDGMRIDAGEAHRVLFEAIASRLAEYGWKPGADREDRGVGTAILWRDLGPARQVFHLYVKCAAAPDKGATLFAAHTLSLEFAFQIPALQETLFGLFPAWRRSGRRRDASMATKPTRT